MIHKRYRYIETITRKVHLLTHSTLNLLLNAQYLHQRNIVTDKIVSRSFVNKQVVLRLLKVLFVYYHKKHKGMANIIVKPVSQLDTISFLSS